MACRLLVSFVALVSVVGATQKPQGKYCGTAMGLHMNMNFTDADHFDVNMIVDDQVYACTQERYTFEATTGSISTEVRNASDCLHGGFHKHMDDPDTVFFAYNGKFITLTVDSVDMELSLAACGLQEANPKPHGKYCGTALGLHMNMNFTDADHFDVNMIVDSLVYACTQERYTFEATTGSISTDVRNASDCLHGGFKKHFYDPDTVFFAYNGKFITLTVDSVNTELSEPQCGLRDAFADAVLV